MHKPINYRYGKFFNEHFNIINRLMSKYPNRFDLSSLFIKNKINDKRNVWGVTLLSGDVDLNLLENSLYIKENIENIVVFQVPHHGSHKGWDNQYLNNFNKTGPVNSIINYGYGNSYGHPKSIVLSDLINNDFNLFFCTQFEGFQYFFRLFL